MRKASFHHGMKLAFLFVLMLFSILPASADEKPPLQLFKQWAGSAEWLRLLHMQKKWTGFESSVQAVPGKPSFFLSTSGSRDPLLEMQTTYSLMFEQGPDKAKEIQCRFLARRDFFQRHAKQDLKASFEKCEFSNEWLQKLNTQKISLVFASGYLNSAASSFGHTFLKLHNPENQQGKELLDYGVNFAARTEDTQGALYALYGLTGYFPGSFGMAPYHQMIKEYTNLEGRDLWEYELDFTAEEVERVLWHLLELEGSYFDYYFLDDNCSFAILKALEIGRPGLQLAGSDELFVIPLDTVKRAEKIFVQRTYRASLQTQWLQIQKSLSSSQKQQIRWSQNFQDWDSQTLSAGQLFYSLKAYDNFEKYKSINYSLSRERARRGRSELTTIETITPSAPEKSHNSSFVQVGALDRDGETRVLTGARFAFHDELSRNSGLTPFSHLEVLGFQWEKTQIRRYRVLEMLSTESVDSFAWPLSWGASAGGDLQPFSETRLQNFLVGKVGWSVDLIDQRLRWSNFATVGGKQDFSDDIQFVAGFESRIWIVWFEGFRSIAKYELQKYPSYRRSTWFLDQAVDLNSQLELRAGLRSGKVEDRQLYETQVFLQQNF